MTCRSHVGVARLDRRAGGHQDRVALRRHRHLQPVHREPPFQAKGLDVHVARGGQDPICPAVGKERVFQVAVHQGRIGLRQDQPAPERRLAGRDQQTVVTPGQAPCQGPGGVGPEAIGEPPLPAFGLDEVAADLATEAHDTG